MSKTTIPLGTGVTGTLGVSNGGTGLSSGTFTGSTTLASAADNGKILQYKRTVLSSSVTRTGTSFSSVMTDTITCSSTSTYLLVICTVNYRMNCNDNTSNPYGNIRLVATPSGGSKDTKADQGLYDINSSGATNIVRDYSGALSAYWNPNTTNQITIGMDNAMGAATGSMTVFGSNQTTNATAFNIFEVSA
jgi:hypothetical protein